MEWYGPEGLDGCDGAVRDRVRLGGIDVDRVDERRVVALVLEAIEAGRGGRIVTPNVDILAAARRSREVRALIEASELVVADGAPLVWASKIAGTPLPQRVAGSDLVWSLAGAASQRGLKLALLGGTPDAVVRPTERAATVLEDRYPGLKIVGSWCPPMGFENVEEHWRALVDRLDVAGPDLVYVGLGFPKQEHVIERLRAVAPRTWFLGCGASIDFIAGYRRRAPKWMQRSGIEWLFRLASEPRRLTQRYLRRDVPEALRLLAEAVRRRQGR